MDDKAVLQLRGISKSFGPTKALSNVDMDIYKGEIHAILGQNGAGKSTLVKILDNVYTEFEGQVVYNSQKISSKDMSGFFKNKLGVVHQEFPLVPHLTVAENIFLNKFPKKKIIKTVNWEELNMITCKLLDSLNISVKPNALIKDLSMGERQLVAIAHALSKNPEVLIFDEATSALTENEVQIIFKLLQELVSKGVAVVYISHKIEEIMSLSNRITVLRDGFSVSTKEVKTTNKTELIKMMAGRDVSHQFPEKISCTEENDAIVVENLTGDLFKNCSFSIKHGEILGIAGLVGSGRPEMMKAIFGAKMIEKGSISINGKAVNIKKPEDAIRNGIYFIPSDRRQEGIFPDLSIRDNTTMALLKSYCKIGKINHKQEDDVTKEYIKKLNTKTRSGKQMIKELSGGNQQKVIISRWISGDGEVYMFDEPTRGLDVGVKYDVYELLNKIKSAGKAVLMISSELPELLAMSDRIIVMHDGRIVLETANNDLEQETILSAMMNQHVM